MGNPILTWNWNFGDGTNSSVGAKSIVTHSYTNAGAFIPTLTCINTNGSTVVGSHGPAITAAYPLSILNSGFEAGTFTNWTQSGSFYSGVAGGAMYAHAGKYGAALETGGTLGLLSQTLTTTPGTVYAISFWFDSPRIYTVTNDIQVSWNGNTLFNKTNLTAIGWTNIQLTVTATESVSTLQFGYLNGYFYFGLDDVSVVPFLPPNVAGASLVGTNLVISGVNGVSGSTNYLLVMGTNLAQPLALWTRISTNILGTSGNFTTTATNATSPASPARFYILQLQ